VDGLRGKVTRRQSVRVQALDRTGKIDGFEATGLYAVCIQHEMDHLIGKTVLDRMTDMSTLTQLANLISTGDTIPVQPFNELAVKNLRL